MEPALNCFQLENQSSDFLDKALSPKLQLQAEQHLASCPACAERLDHYRQIISRIAAQKTVVVPTDLRKAPLSAVLPRITASKMTLSQWERIPWYIRTSFEAIGIIILVLTGISAVPKLRSLYEKSIEKTLLEFKESFSVSENSIETTDNSLPKLDSNPLQKKSNEQEDEIFGEDEVNDVKAGKSQLWRFTLKTVSPDELRPQVVKVLTGLKVPATMPGLGGIQVPGGIEFDLILPQTLVPEIKQALEKLAPISPDSKPAAPGSEIFSWYKVKSKKKIPDGKSQVVIWLSQPN